MTISDEEDEIFAQFIESEVLSDSNDDDDDGYLRDDSHFKPPSAKRLCFECPHEDFRCSSSSLCPWKFGVNKDIPGGIESGNFTKVPSELYLNILKFLSSEDLISCSRVCRFLNYIASDESLWRRLYGMRWGLLNHAMKLSEITWKRLYIQRDGEDMIECVRNSPLEFKQYYLQMQAAKRSQAPLPSQVNDEKAIIEKTLADQITAWKRSKGLADEAAPDHACSALTCSYYQIGDVFICEKTGSVHVCGESCREVIMDSMNGEEVCTISGQCSALILSIDEAESDIEPNGTGDEAEPFMGSGRYARAYQLGYNCVDEKELEYTLRFC